MTAYVEDISFLIAGHTFAQNINKNYCYQSGAWGTQPSWLILCLRMTLIHEGHILRQDWQRRTEQGKEKKRNARRRTGKGGGIVVPLAWLQCQWLAAAQLASLSLSQRDAAVWPRAADSIAHAQLLWYALIQWATTTTLHQCLVVPTSSNLNGVRIAYL